MAKWQYRITTHTAAEVLEELDGPVGEVPQSIYCDDEGACYFDPGPNPFTQAIENVLNHIGEEGWELAQVLFRPQQMICFWKRSR